MTGLVGDLRAQVTLLENDLRARVDGPDEFMREEGVAERWKTEHADALNAERTAASWQAWRDERVTQAASAWVLLTVFARFCEDNRLVSPVWIAGASREDRQRALDARQAYFQTHPEHNDRHWLQQIIEHFASIGATAGLVDSYSPIHQVSPSGDAARRLLEFWWDQDSNGELLRRFGPAVNPELDTRFLGDLYQDLSEFAKKNYALLQTPEFVEEFILDHTLEPALRERPLDGFSVIDPACGSGHFLLGAFHRLLDRWSRQAPNLETRALVQHALDGVHGVDINPFAVAIARFRLIVAALRAAGARSLENAPDFQIQLAAGDSLIYGAPQQTLDENLILMAKDDFSYSTEDNALLKDIFRRRYDVVVGNPPYIPAKDKAARKLYRTLYRHCKGIYALTVPFMELFFNVARQGEHPGRIGKITSNSFMKREFGKSLVENFLPGRDLRTIIDSEGAWIPGHNSDGTPTVILFAVNSVPRTPSVRAVLSKGKREASSVGEVGEGPFWRSIVENIETPGFDNDWINVDDLERGTLQRHPWILSGGGAGELINKIDYSTPRQISSVVKRVGFMAMSHADEEFSRPSPVVGRNELESTAWIPLVTGDDIRDYHVASDRKVWFPYGTSELPALEILPRSARHLWPLRTHLGNRASFNGLTYSAAGKPWYAWHQVPADRGACTHSIAFSEVATHNHFILDRGGRVLNQSAPVVKLGSTASDTDLFSLLALLNSSTACFWLRQKCKPKGGAADQIWLRTYQFNASRVKQFPIPANAPAGRARRLDKLAQRLSDTEPQEVVKLHAPTRGELDILGIENGRIKAQLIAEQEELDWECYRIYGLIDEELTFGGELPELALGERAFEIVMARAMNEGEETTWFERHRSTPITEIPEHWPADYRDLVQRRLDVIASNKNIRQLEKPEYKRRWAIDPWEKRVEEALRGWLLDRLEDRALWFDNQGRPRPRSVARLADIVARDDEFRGVLELWAGRPDLPVAVCLQDLLGNSAVPYLAAYRYKDSGLEKRAAWEEIWRLQRKEDAGETLDAPIPVPPKYKPADFTRTEYWQHRGDFDIPKERFILYPDAGRETDPTPFLGWAGWDHAEQALALARIMNEREQDGWDDKQMIPLIAGLAELQPWVRQWHGEIDPTYGLSLAAIVDEELESRRQRAGVTVEDLVAWRPEKRARGRRSRRQAAAPALTREP
ncbi:BREX-2 system adenine-specific DNA-methyltransferase PglX [Phytoactinopolyspora mesophila]|uniref:BREX-2 system adenine-specific DNA-methyltransferase PglX n=1 Tax=Phytoactinopolyspora mesophila TaxID=2650750 RepID=UPI001C9E29E0